MKSVRFIITIIILTLWPPNLWADTFRDLPNITVLAASSLTDPITELARIYSRKNAITVTASFNSSSEQAWKIQDGDSADIFISSHPYWMAEVKQMGLIDVYSLSNIVRNKLALVISAKSRLNGYPIPEESLGNKIDYLNNRTILVMGNPDNTALGLYTKQAILSVDKNNGTGIWKKLEGRTLYSFSAKNNLYLIAHGETAGIAYYSDTHGNNEVKVLEVIDENLHEPIIYQAAVVAGENMANARQFLKFLLSDEAKIVFKKHGFITD